MQNTLHIPPFLKSGKMNRLSSFAGLRSLAISAKKEKNVSNIFLIHSVRRQFATTNSIRRSSAGPVQKGHVSPLRSIPPNIVATDYYASGSPKLAPEGEIAIYESINEIEKIRKAAKLARKMLEYANSLVVPGISTDEIDYLTHKEIVHHGACPTPLNYCGFPKSICTSVNEVACHGIPDSRILQDGDIISIDVSLFLDGFHGDNCGTVPVGPVAHADTDLISLIETNKLAVKEAIKICKPGVCISKIGAVIESIARNAKYGVIHDFCGHGTGRYIHQSPLILPYYDPSYTFPMEPGMVFTIEPIFTLGNKGIHTWSDGWTAATKDGQWTSQIEHEVLITDSGVEVLTVRER